MEKWTEIAFTESEDSSRRQYVIRYIPLLHGALTENFATLPRPCITLNSTDGAPTKMENTLLLQSYKTAGQGQGTSKRIHRSASGHGFFPFHPPPLVVQPPFPTLHSSLFAQSRSVNVHFHRRKISSLPMKKLTSIMAAARVLPSQCRLLQSKYPRPPRPAAPQGK